MERKRRITYCCDDGCVVVNYLEFTQPDPVSEEVVSVTRLCFPEVPSTQYHMRPRQQGRGALPDEMTQEGKSIQESSEVSNSISGEVTLPQAPVPSKGQPLWTKARKPDWAFFLPPVEWSDLRQLLLSSRS